jgi:hypothetical protein
MRSTFRVHDEIISAERPPSKILVTSGAQQAIGLVAAWEAYAPAARPGAARAAPAPAQVDVLV